MLYIVCVQALLCSAALSMPFQSLLDSMKFPPSYASRRRIKKDFSLGMEEFGDPWSDVGESDSEDFQPTKKKTKINPEKAYAK